MGGYPVPRAVSGQRAAERIDRGGGLLPPVTCGGVPVGAGWRRGTNGKICIHQLPISAAAAAAVGGADGIDRRTGA